MLGLMQDWPLLCHRVIDHAKIQHGNREVISRSIEGPIHRTNYAEIHARSLKVAQALERLGVKEGDRVGTMAWNTWRHMESWYGIMGAGGVYHTLNPRLFPEQLVYIINHAEDRFLFIDLTFVPLIEALQDKLPMLEAVIIMTDREHMPETTIKNPLCYEEWIDDVDGDYVWKSLDENAAAGMCYTSGTTGNPKGVVYSHRSNVIHSLANGSVDMLGLSSRDRVMPVVPFFHANGWSLAFSGPMFGASMIMPGMMMDGASIWELLDTERVSLTAAVPTIWLMLLQYMEAENKSLEYLDKVIIGGSACPRGMTQAFQEKYNVDVVHAWGMTEMSPLGSLCSIKPEYADLEGEAKLDLQEKQGFAPFSIEMKIEDDEGNEMPWDGKTFGRLKVRGPAVSSSYFKEEGGEILDENGFFDTGDVAHIDQYGYMQITDRSKDVIKSGGEWISSIDVENKAVGHPDVAEAAVIGVEHPKWDERPLLIIVPMEGKTPTFDELKEYLSDKIVSWWMPDDMVIVDEIPHTATGKIQKMALREMFKDHKLPTADIAGPATKR
ncbi:MAG: long-chain-fatty-acid--CoA ligase [Rhizobiales bacterium]|nr:long-chain-fatty-acid--CoA ligase [Hyphomicrobiales bacterium]